jgi:hypothetical protein
MVVNEPPVGVTRHPWNQTFVWSLPDTAPTAISATERSAFDREGFLVLPELIDPSSVAALRSELDELEVEVEQLLARALPPAKNRNGVPIAFCRAESQATHAGTARSHLAGGGRDVGQ